MLTEMLSRRSALKSTLGLIAAPALPAATTAPAIGTVPMHSPVDFRKAFHEYLAAYRAYCPMPDGPDDDAPDEAREAHTEECDRLCDKWSDSRSRLLEMVLNNHGSTFDEWTSNVGGLAVDIGDLVFVAGPDPDEEGCRGGGSHLVIVPRSAEMTALLDGLYVPPEREPKPPQVLTDETPLSRRPYQETVQIVHSRMPA